MAAINRKEVTVTGITAKDKVYDGNTEAELEYNSVAFNGIVKGDELSVTATGTFEDAEIGQGKTVNITNITLGGRSAGNYVLSENSQTSAEANITETEPEEHPSQNQMEFFLLTEMPKTGFPALRPTALSEKPQKLDYSPVRLTLELPTLSVTADVVMVPRIDGEYPIEWLGADTGLLEGSAMPGEGLSIITAHNHLNTTEAGPFAMLSALEEGERIFVVNEENELLSFRIYTNEKLAANDLAGLRRIAEAGSNALLLITCEDESVDGGYINRRIIAAEPVS